MFRRMSGEGQLSDGHSSSSLTGHGVTYPGSDSQESSWVGLLSMVSRPALSFLQKYLPGRARPSAPCDTRVEWIDRGMISFVDEESEFLRQLDDLVPLPQHAAHHMSYLRCQHGGAAALLETTGGCGVPWLTADSLRELGIQSAEELAQNNYQQGQTGSLTPSRTLLSHVWLNSVPSEEVQASGGTDWEMVGSPVKSTDGKSRTWWGNLWGAEESPERGLFSDLSQVEEGTLTGWLCPPQLLANTKGPAGETTAAIVQSSSSSSGWTLGENTGPTDHKKESVDIGGLQTVQNREVSMPDHLISTRKHLSGLEAASTCSEAATSSPDQDNGYYSLEEEHQFMVKALSGEQDTRSTETIKVGMEEETSEEVGSTSGQVDREEETEEEGGIQPAEVPVLTTPQCQNKTIAFIMGCPCSDDDSSQSDESSDDDDDDGFDSEGSSDLSDSTDEDDDETSDSEVDSEVERLWSSLCQSVDPYNPRNFTARLHTSSTLPRNIPTTTPPSSTQSSPTSSPGLTPLPLSSPPSDQDVWEDSTSASEVDEAESLHLWSSFSCSSDPYNPLNFQASLRTQGSTEAGPQVRAKKAPQIPLRSFHPAPPPEHLKEEAEERLDSGFSEPTTSSRMQSCRFTKKVRFQDDVEEFFISCGEEDRRGPWEELARDRCRFLRRCQEVEQSIAYCLQPEHRRLAYRRLTVLLVQDH